MCVAQSGFPCETKQVLKTMIFFGGGEDERHLRLREIMR